MIRPIFLHIGLPKTGTSSIQQYLRNNRAPMRRQGFVVPTTLGRLNHEHVTLHALADRDKSTVRRRHGLLSVEAVRTFREGLRAELAKEAAAWSLDEAVVVSGEHMSMLHKPEEFERLKELTAVMGASRPVRVVVYLRRQDLYCLSGYSQRIKAGAVLQWSELEKEIDRSEFDYEAMLARWSGSFGKESIDVRVFERGQWAGGELISDFMAALGCSIGPEFGKAIHKNASLDIRSLEFMRRLNRWYPRLVDGAPNPQRQKLVSAMHKISAGPPARMKPELAAKFLERYRDGNARVAREYLGRSDGRLFLVDPGDEHEQPPVLTLDDAVELSARLWAVASGLDAPSRKADKAESDIGL